MCHWGSESEEVYSIRIATDTKLGVIGGDLKNRIKIQKHVIGWNNGPKRMG